MIHPSRSEAQKRAEKKYNEKREPRHRCYTGIFYLDSMPDDWDDQISDVHLQVWVSPCHDKDTWSASDARKDHRHKAGHAKKPHYHYVVEYPSPVPLSVFLKDFAFLNGVQGTVVRDKVAMVRYLIHMDDPKKAQYDVNDMRCFGGADVSPIYTLGICERYEAVKDMQRFIVDNEIVDFYQFVLYCDDCMPHWANLVNFSCAYIIDRFIGSFRAAKQKEREELMRIEQGRQIASRVDAKAAEEEAKAQAEAEAEVVLDRDAAEKAFFGYVDNLREEL